MSTPAPLLSINDAAEILHITPQTVRRWWLLGLIPGARLGRQVRFTLEVIERVRREGVDLTQSR